MFSLCGVQIGGWPTPPRDYHCSRPNRQCKSARRTNKLKWYFTGVGQQKRWYFRGSGNPISIISTLLFYGISRSIFSRGLGPRDVRTKSVVLSFKALSKQACSLHRHQAQIPTISTTIVVYNSPLKQKWPKNLNSKFLSLFQCQSLVLPVILFIFC